jgi:hypothetical protein
MAVTSHDLRHLADAVDRLRGVDAVVIVRDGMPRVVARTEMLDGDHVCFVCRNDDARVRPVSDTQDEPWFGDPAN